MARPTLLPSPSPCATVKREIDAAEHTDHTPAPPPRKKRRREGRSPVTPTQLPLSPPLVTPQTILSGVSGNASFAGPTPTPARFTAKLEPGLDADVEAHGRTARKQKKDSQDLRPGTGPEAGEAPLLCLNRRRLGRILHELAGAHQWRDAASVVSTLLRGYRKPDSFEETRRIFVVAMEIHKQLAEGSSVRQGGRSSYYLRTQKLFNVWMRKLIWFPSSPKKYLVTLELALFHLSQGNIDNAHITTRTLIAKDSLQTHPVVNLIHGLILFDKWYSGLPKDMQVKEFEVYDESCDISMKSNGCEETDLLDDSDDKSIYVDDSSLPTCSSECSINNEDTDRKMNGKPSYIHPKEEMDPLESQVNENFRSIFLNTSDGPSCGLEKSLLPLRLKLPTGDSDDCFDKYWKYKSTPNTLYEEAEKCLRFALYSNPPVIAALLPLIQEFVPAFEPGMVIEVASAPGFSGLPILLLGDKLKDALDELEKACISSTTALPFRLRGRLLEEYDQNQVSTISSCYEEALRRDPTCRYSMERLIRMHRKGYYNTIQLFEAIAIHLDSVDGKPYIWEELVSCFLRLFSDNTADYEDCISCTSSQGDQALGSFSKFSSVFFERLTRESWKARCRWWMHHHFSQNAYISDTSTGDCKLVASKAACAAHLFGPEFPYVKAAGSYITKQEALDEISLLVRNKQNSVRLLETLEKLAS
ncbi:hypothetical protein U9M48_029124 [Paspalum notatum var. saurae]|uniref:Uncharacterized protein n=1 Tax=Paspalum notatum var. saurae TaxID=547442 RepID=A0AAQ3U2L7_PASNO